MRKSFNLNKAGVDSRDTPQAGTPQLSCDYSQRLRSDALILCLLDHIKGKLRVAV